MLTDAIDQLRDTLYSALSRCQCGTGSCPKCEEDKAEFVSAVTDMLIATVDETTERFRLVLHTVQGSDDPLTRIKEQRKEAMLVFQNWMKDGEDISYTDEGIELSLGDFHGGTVFAARLMLDEDQEADLRTALATGAYPVFYVMEIK